MFNERSFITRERTHLPNNLRDVGSMVDDAWGRVYDQAVAEVTRGWAPSWGMNARYMTLLKRQAYLEGDKHRSKVLGDTLQGLREREERGDTAPMGPQRRGRPSGFDILFGGYDLIRKLGALMDAQKQD